MKLKRIIAGASLVAILPFSSFAALGNQLEILPANDDQAKIINAMPISIELSESVYSYYSSFTGTVKEIRDFEGVKGARFVLLENEDGQQANLIVSEDTYYINDNKITLGAEVTGYYETDAPMLMIYPAQYNAKIVSVDLQDEKVNIKADLFDQDLLSRDQSLKLNIAEDTKIITQEGEAFEGELQNRKLIVFYGATTKSLPAQTSPSKIVVMNEDIEAPVEDLEDEQDLLWDVSTMDIIVEDQQIEAPKAYANEKGTVMVPLRAIAEALDFEVSWNEKEQKVVLSDDITLKIGDSTYTKQDTALELESAPELVEGMTYVPLQFFKTVAEMNNAYVLEEQIVIDNGEVME